MIELVESVLIVFAEGKVLLAYYLYLVIVLWVIARAKQEDEPLPLHWAKTHITPVKMDFTDFVSVVDSLSAMLSDIA